ncbi:MAG TPA: hypothetical protein VLW65_15020 [Bryobacteraceae bacterium]|nr:hypothetical protein [Terriglobia bacterium]HUK17733.1 hypothetical protein [Bryobacteraceae bacterium]
MRNLWMQSISLIAAAASLTAADSFWKSKPANQWTEEDAKQILVASPWAREVNAVVTRRLTEEELRQGGQMGQPLGVGNEGVDPKGSGPKVSLNVFTGPGGDDRSRRSLARPIALKLRWENALPVRIAELTSHAVELPTLDGDGYRIAVYGIPGAGFKGQPEELGKPLKNLAALKREGKKDVRPVSAEVFQLEDGVVVVYRFPLSAEITRQDRQIRFEAQIGRIVVAQTFELSEMEFMGKLEL